MSSRPQFSPHKVFTDATLPSSSTLISQPTIVQMLSQISYDISWSASTAVGVMSVQVSDTYTQNADGTVRNAGNWTTLTLTGTPPAISGSSGNGFIDIGATGAFAIRLVYTATSGSGILNATIYAKVA